ncbi:uncharacterized protein I206_100856 [Kwoniella pini CBS 10737]|uniref:Uncharacterized protein n=1 Tax=Kwoniella pini CBS 10737 TaxID=1296096 RepID=A0A1B9IC33_9TREE|nr:uncharacterized protein I206_00470 [Kwoniella pini CBS 10737]OCF53169.1 hypothetical protein I206_00470 [Kwoniella pini CBS 10737]
MKGSTKVHALDTDSDLTDLSDIDMKEDEQQSIKNDDTHSSESRNGSNNEGRSIKRKASSVPSVDSDAESDYAAKPLKKKPKKKASKRKTTKSKSTKSKGQSKTKNTKNRNAEDGDVDDQEEKPKKRVLLAKEVHWDDLPDWGDRTDCPLMKLPADILDMCFSTETDLNVRDYVALAGVSKYFRDRLTPKVFHCICWTKNVRRTSYSYLRPEFIVKPENLSIGKHIFSRGFKPWQIAKRTYKYCNRFLDNHYIPCGPRDQWSEAQYIVYKEEQDKWRQQVKQWKIKELRSEMDRKQQEERKEKTYAFLGNYRRTVLGAVAGRKDGEPPVQKDTRGLPIVNQKQAEEENEKAEEPDHADIAAHPKTSRKRKSILTNKKRWTVPDTDTEAEYEVSPHEYLKPDEPFVFDHWPNEWRALAVEWIHLKRINKTAAMRVFKVSEAELLCLSHLLVTNPMSSKNPQQAYLEVAVEALAFRSHGGPQGHKASLQARAERSARMAQSREEKTVQAKKDGTYVYKHRKMQIAPYDWHWKQYDIHGPNGNCDSECEACLHDGWSE